jgi:hypothetical protein
VLRLRRGQFLLILGTIWLLVLAVQVAVFLRSELSVRDACGVYLPLARAAGQGDWEHAQSVMFPPLYPVLTGLVSRLIPVGEYPEQLAGALVNFIAFHVMLACVLVICLSLWSRRVAVVAVGLAGLNPRLVQMSVNVWTEPLYVAIVTLATATIVLTRDRLRWWACVALGALGGLGGLTRSEGVLLPGVIVLSLLVCHARRGRKKIAGAVAAAAVALVIPLAIWLPRVMFVHGRTGCAVVDMRAASFLGADESTFDVRWEAPIAVEHLGPTLRDIPRGAWHRSGPVFAEEPLKWIFESLEGLVNGWNPAAIFLAVFGLIRRRPLRRHGRAELVLGALVAVQVVASGVSLYLNPRYVAVVAPLVAVFAGAGAISLVAWLGSRRLGPQLAVLGLLLVVCAVFCVRRAQRRHSETRYAGEFVLRRRGPGSIIFARTSEPPYYARGRLVPVISWRDVTYTNAQILSILGETGATHLLLDREHRWCPQFRARYEAGAFDEAVIPIPLRENSDELVLFDARALRGILAAEAGGGAAEQNAR